MMKIVNIMICTAAILLVAACNSGGSAKQGKDSDQPSNKAAAGTISAWTDSIAADSTRADLYLNRAQAYMKENQVGAAMMDISKAIGIEPNNVEAYLFLSDIYYVLDDETNIKNTLNRAEEIAPNDPRPMLKQAELCLMQENYTLSMAYIDKALGLNKYNPRAYFLKGTWYMVRQDTSEAVKNFLIAREQDGTFFDPVRELALIFSAQNNPMAEDFLKSSAQQFPDEEILRYELALFLQDHGKPEEAMACYDTLLVTNPNSKILMFNKGYVSLVYLGKSKEAVDYFDKALEIDPNFVDALYNKGRALEQMGDYSAASDIYSQVLKRQPDYELAVSAINRVNNRAAD